MTDNVVSLAKVRQESRLLWVCGCGCTGHYLYADGQAGCSSCGKPTDAPFAGQWREKLPEPPEDPPQLDGPNFCIINLQSPEVWLKRCLKDDPEDIVVAVALMVDGGVSTWAEPDRVETEEQRAWLDRKLAQARQQIAPDA